uniref:Class I SAM-dependent methyltransferase n=1 Tax=Eiseniibacteriota bacterium TaxID=2212470 RepID=A0A832MK55_UNCEI
MTYRPRDFWERRLSQHFDLRGTGEPGLSLAYNRACYALRRRVLDRALREAGVDPRGRRVLDVGCGTGFFTRHYLARGASVTGVDIAPVSVERLARELPEARFVLADVSESVPEGRYDIVNAFDVLYHITDDAGWEAAVRHLCGAVDSLGTLLLTDTFAELPGLADHNRSRPLARYRTLLAAEGLEIREVYPTHVLLNRELGALRVLNRLPALLYAADRVLLALGAGHDDPVVSKLLVAQRKR